MTQQSPFFPILCVEDIVGGKILFISLSLHKKVQFSIIGMLLHQVLVADKKSNELILFSSSVHFML